MLNPLEEQHYELAVVVAEGLPHPEIRPCEACGATGMVESDTPLPEVSITGMPGYRALTRRERWLEERGVGWFPAAVSYGVTVCRECGGTGKF